MQWFVMFFFIGGLFILIYNMFEKSDLTSSVCSDPERRSLQIEYTLRLVLAAGTSDKDPRIVNCTASTEEMKSGIAALIDKDVQVVEIVRSLLSDKHQFLAHDPDPDAAQADEILTKIIIPEIDSTELLAKSGGRLSVEGGTSGVIIGGAYYIEWAKGMISYGVKGAAQPLTQWPREVHLRRAGRKIYLEDEDKHLIIPGLKYIDFHLIPYTAAMIVAVMVSGQSPKPLVDKLEEVTGVKNFGLDDSWKTWWQEHKAKDFRIMDP